MLKKFKIQLRKKSTPHEQLLWSFLRNRKLNRYKFRRQEIIGNYIVDFVCYEKKLIIELDGGQHIENKNYDDKRTLDLESLGFQVIRIWNNQLVGNIEKILEKINFYLSSRV